MELHKKNQDLELKEIELIRGKEKAEKDVHSLKKECRLYQERVNKVKKERDEFAAELATLQVVPVFSRVVGVLLT